ncbi:pirin family protein [Psychromicrobium xiongbiense]|uniref:pirin family protein n=1 Tax=Psychromicrobium xiongbiense TaxID=3051184 RepID=UPI0025575782|nr:pirin family protein [Psychromicrobium sp. YIM S02556]
MTDLEAQPEPVQCPAGVATDPCVQLWPERLVPLGGIRAVPVSRTLPQRGLPTVGAWCFLDSFSSAEPTMSVLPHPHIGLQTVTWPLKGTIRHRDSLGSEVLVRPGELNLMTAGRGVAHSEFSVIDETVIDKTVVKTAEGQVAMRGLQLWIALPEQTRNGPAAFEQHTELPRFTLDGSQVTVLLGELAGHRSPATIYTPLLGAEIAHDGGRLSLPLRPTFEHALLVLDGVLTIDGTEVQPGPLAYLGAGRDRLEAIAAPGTRFLVIGGEPFAEELVMWWNFVARTHEEIEQAREDWQESMSRGPGEPAQNAARQRFPAVAGHDAGSGPQAGWIPAPPLPPLRLKPRRRTLLPEDRPEDLPEDPPKE